MPVFRSFVAPLAAALLLIASASAHAQEEPPPTPGFEVTTEVHKDKDFDVPTVQFAGHGDGCWDYNGGFDEDDGTCTTMKLQLSRKGRVVKRVPDFLQPVDEDDPTLGYMGSYFHEWSCKGTGLWTWRATYTNDSVTGPDGNDFTATEKGSFRVPRCRTPTPRAVGQGTAAEHADAEVQNAFEDEFISQVRCAMEGKRSRWSCDVRHNNTYRECTRRVRLSFFKRDEFKRKLNGYRVVSNRKLSCRYF